MELIRPEYYKKCAVLGRKLLSEAKFPSTDFDCECKEIIRFLGNDFDLGSCLKYLWRVGEKNEDVESDLNKSLFYIEEFLNNYMVDDGIDETHLMETDALYRSMCKLRISISEHIAIEKDAKSN